MMTAHGLAVGLFVAFTFGSVALGSVAQATQSRQRERVAESAEDIHPLLITKSD